jgi:hypothetical protein
MDVDNILKEIRKIVNKDTNTGYEVDRFLGLCRNLDAWIIREGFLPVGMTRQEAIDWGFEGYESKV